VCALIACAFLCVCLSVCVLRVCAFVCVCACVSFFVCVVVCALVCLCFYVCMLLCVVCVFVCARAHERSLAGASPRESITLGMYI